MYDDSLTVITFFVFLWNYIQETSIYFLKKFSTIYYHCALKIYCWPLLIPILLNTLPIETYFQAPLATDPNKCPIAGMRPFPIVILYIKDAHGGSFPLLIS